MLQVVVKTALVVGTVAALYLLYVLRSLVLTVFAAIVFASALRPILAALQRRLRLPRPAAVLGVYVFIVLAIAGGAAVALPFIIADARSLAGRSTEIYARWYELALGLRSSALARFSIVLPVPPAQAEATAWLAAVGAAVQRQLPAYAIGAGQLLAEILLGLVLAYYWFEARDELLDLGFRALPPRRRAIFHAAMDDVERVLGAYLGGQLILSSLVAVASLLAFLALGLPHAGLLALADGLLHIIPLVGASIGIIPPIVIAISISPARGLLTAVVLIVIHQVENHLVAPRVLQKQMGLNPLLVMIALAAGIALDGVVGALLALPAAGVLWILAHHFLVQPAVGRWAGDGPPASVDENTAE